MKKTILILLFILAGAGLMAQKVKISPGIKLGYTLSDLTPDYTDSTGNTTSYSLAGSYRIGAFAVIPAGKDMMVQATIFLSRKRTSYKHTLTSPPYGPPSGFLPFSYIELPLSLLYKKPSGEGFFYGGGGISPAFRIWRDYYYNTEKFDLGLNLVAGYQTQLGFSFQLDFTKGFIPVLEDFYTSDKQKFSTIGLTFGYTF